MKHNHDASALSAWGTANPLVTWLISRGQAGLLTQTPRRIRVAAGRTPRCPVCDALMVRRVGGWVCYRTTAHDRPERINDEFSEPTP